MKWVATGDQVRRLESQWFDDYGLSPSSLMEVAGRSAADWIVTHRRAEITKGVWVVCGPGNNGGDGYVIARTLHAQGVAVQAVGCGEPSSETAKQAEICRRSGVPTHTRLPSGPTPGLVVDALFGIGCRRALSGQYLQTAERICAMACDVISVDMPSGVCADTGGTHGGAHITASATLTFEHAKRGLYLVAGPKAAGTLVVLPLHLGQPSRDDGLAQCWERDDVQASWPTRARDAHKGHSGHLLIIAGSRAMAGAAALTVKGAFSVGVGRVTLLTPQDAHIRLSNLPPEAMLAPGWREDLEVRPALGDYSAVVAGPGMGTPPPRMAQWLREIWQDSTRPVIFDADALPFAMEGKRSDRVLTPHPGEAGRLLHRPASSVNAARVDSVQQLSRRGVVLLKGQHTLIGDPTGRLAFNTTGSPTLATAGSGDVLSGIVAGLAARGLPAWEASCAGAWLHGRAGEAMEAVRPDGWFASDIAAQISACIPT